MKKVYIFLVGLSVLSTSLAGCDNKPHERTWGTPTYTWADDYSSCTAERVCSSDPTHKETETVNSTYMVVTESSCEADGLGRYTVLFENSAFAMQTHDTVIEAFGHVYKFDSFVWTDFTAQAKYVCSHDSSHIEYHNATVTSKVTTAPLCEKSGVRTYTATYDGHSDTKTEVLSELGHNWGEPTYTWSDDYSSCTAERVCLNDSSHKETETVDSTYEVVTPASEENEGLGRYTATFSLVAFTSQVHDSTIDKLIYCGETPRLSSDGKTITYGLYPQTNVNDPSLISALDALSKSNYSDFLHLYKNEYYVQTTASPSKANYTFDNGTTIVSGTKYWFKCKPITWNVLANSDGEYTLLSNVLLDAHYFTNSSSTRQLDDGEIVYASNYEKGKFMDIRGWLNSSFFELAFALGDSFIQTTTVDNSPSTAGMSGDTFACNNTNDKVFLLSYKDYLNSDYGFSTSTNATNTRYCKTTDYARARGAYYNTSSSYLYNGYYWTRSPNGEAYVKAVKQDGSLGESYVTDKSFGVRPAITIKL